MSKKLPTTLAGARTALAEVDMRLRSGQLCDLGEHQAENRRRRLLRLIAKLEKGAR
jgi:hypothetical protein